MDRNGSAGLSALEEFCAWHGTDLAASPSYMAALASEETAELMAALPGLRTRSTSAAHLRRADVPLGALTARLSDWRDQLVYGRGFVLLRRLPIERMSEDQIALSLAALSAHLGRTRFQAERLYGSECALPFGTAEGAISALLCLREPEQGFTLRVASAVALHNELLAHNPRLLEKLYRPEEGAPAFTRAGHKLAANFARGCRPVKAEVAALSLAETLGLSLDFEPGDVLFINNRHALHGVARQGARGTLLHLSIDSGLVAAHAAVENPQASPASRQDESVESAAA